MSGKHPCPRSNIFACFPSFEVCPMPAFQKEPVGCLARVCQHRGRILTLGHVYKNRECHTLPFRSNRTWTPMVLEQPFIYLCRLTPPVIACLCTLCCRGRCFESALFLPVKANAYPSRHPWHGWQPLLAVNYRQRIRLV